MMDFTGWKYYKAPNGKNIGITIKNGDTQESRSLQDPEVAEWLAEGNEPLPAENT
jgi:hypothetical protein